MQESAAFVPMDGCISNVPAFLTKLWTLVEDPETNHLICWNSNGTSFHVFDQGRFAKEVLPKYFKHNNMASFVRQLNMYGFRKVVNIEQSGLVKPERDDTEFQHLYFLQGHEHLLEHIKRKVSVVKSEEMKLRQEDFSRLLYEVHLLRNQHDSTDSQIRDMKQQNEVLWREVVSLRQTHSQQQKAINKLIHFLFGQMPTNHSGAGLKRKVPLMLDGGSCCSSPVSKCSRNLSSESLQHSYFIQSPPSEPATSLDSPGVAGGPIISDVTEISPPSELTLQPPSQEERAKCLLLVKEEPASPAGQGPTDPNSVPMSPCNLCASEPPVLPVSMVQSVLEDRGNRNSQLSGGSQAGERRARRALLDRTEIAASLEGTEVSLEGLQLLLRSQQYNWESSPLLDVFSPSLPVGEWNQDDMDGQLSSFVFLHQDAEAYLGDGEEEQ
ncbi:heat shock factor protein 4 [Latimeria chalumnae]|uniref:heat shock factor protein 4 n=1 Tax=Latimeria chalumnae TaxID=7897 RepID=UPI00313D27A6